MTGHGDGSDHAAQRRRGCMLGLAVGDALGAPVEFASRAWILEEYGPAGIQDFAPTGRQPAGAYTDDTQLSVATARGILDWREAPGWASERGEEPDLDSLALAIWEQYRKWGRSPECPLGAPGATCLKVIGSGTPRTLDTPMDSRGKGCGGVMRVAPVGLAGLRAATFEAAARAGTLTHRHPTSDTSCGFLGVLVARLVDGAAPAHAVDAARGELLGWDGHTETLNAVDTAVRLAATDVDDYAALRRIGHVGTEAPQAPGKGWVAEEALGIGLFCALRHRDDFAGAVRAAANISGDSDSTASIAGAICGAALGADAIPATWVERVQDRDLLIDLADRLDAMARGEPA
jgi:ADP-ribosylglycohydrolase